MKAAAPSALADELAAAIVPCGLKAGLRAGISSGDTFDGFSSFAMTFAPPFPGTTIGAI